MRKTLEEEATRDALEQAKEKSEEFRKQTETARIKEESDELDELEEIDYVIMVISLVKGPTRDHED